MLLAFFAGIRSTPSMTVETSGKLVPLLMRNVVVVQVLGWPLQT